MGCLRTPHKRLTFRSHARRVRDLVADVMRELGEDEEPVIMYAGRVLNKLPGHARLHKVLPTLAQDYCLIVLLRRDGVVQYPWTTSEQGGSSL